MQKFSFVFLTKKAISILLSFTMWCFTMWSFAIWCSAAPQKSEKEATPYPVIEWPDLMPAEDLEALLNPPDYINDIEEGSMEDQIRRSVKTAITNASDDRYQQALVSERVRPEFDNRKVTIPGFVVPLEFDDQMVISEFFLVPFFGACIHVPPPPPNQMIHVKYDKGLKIDSLYDPFFLEGTLKIKSFSTDDMGSSAYSMNVSKIYPYTE
ncbi:hypothetical protein TDB9533_03064 [Thalassocella blandensis]|nr:hypothetical protein TDB9533_03064 [Thalassocella blandensis]